ncbi:MAG: type VII toxin-antitoxin system MntA family adenylyltransferase antitoxin [Ardenticatenaceae bacterium]
MSSIILASQTIENLKCCLPLILQSSPILLAYAYGSVAAGVPTPLSDVDIALVLSPDREQSPYERFLIPSEIALTIEARYSIQDADVRIVNDAPLRVQGRVVTEGTLLYSRDETFRITYEVQTRKRYFDFQPVLAMMREAYFARLEQELKEKALYGE